jgi:hypothetical protein
MKGGEHGPAIVPFNLAKSGMHIVVALPLEDSFHMPPKGKPQPTADEIKLIAWWIGQGADFNKKINQMAMTPEIESILKPQPKKQNPVYNVNIKKADPSVIAQLQEADIAVMPLGVDNALLSVSMAGNKALTTEGVKNIKKLAEQITHLDFSHTNITDVMLASIGNLPHLSRLNISNTGISDVGLKVFNNSPYLETINIVGTKITDKGLENLTNAPQLTSIYCWNSAVTTAGLSVLKNKIPQLVVEMAKPDTAMSAPLKMRPPKILHTKNIFDDTLQVTLNFPFKQADVYYTINGDSPTIQASRYTGEAIVLDKSMTLKAITTRPGWSNSLMESQHFIKRKHRPLSIALEKPPSPKYPGRGSLTLMDGKTATNTNKKDYIGYEGEHMTAIIDYGKSIDIDTIKVHCLENNGSWIFLPKSIQAWGSEDGVNYAPLATQSYPVNTKYEPVRGHYLSLKLKKTAMARYVKVKVESILKNPQWHNNRGEKCWIYVDEIFTQ